MACGFFASGGYRGSIRAPRGRSDPTMLPDLLEPSAAILGGGILVAGGWDLARREVPGPLWLGLAAVAVALGYLGLPPGSPATAWILWTLVAGVAVEHLVDWEGPIGARWARAPLVLDLAIYIGSVSVVLGLLAIYGWGSPEVPVAAVAVLGVVVLARLLFEARILGGGADAKALIVIGLLVPFFPTTWLPIDPRALAPLSAIPFAITALTNAALGAIAVPVGLAVWNAVRGEWAGTRSFATYTLAVRHLPDRFVWAEEVPDGARYDPDGAESAAEDRAMREQLRRELEARGVARVRVSPQIPMVALLALGVLLGLAAGNLLFDLAAAL